jgi:hypothetical protein
MKYKYHYVYRITNIFLNKHYIGVKSSNCDPIDDLGIKYFSSSKDKEFKSDQLINPNNYKYKIIRMFENRLEASELEIELHNKFNVGVNKSFYNKAKQISSGFSTFGTKHSEKTKRQMKLSQTGKKLSNITKKRMSFSSNGSKNPSAKKINVYNKVGKLIFNCYGNFEKICKKNNLPFESFKKSYQKGSKLSIKRKGGRTRSFIERYKQYNGWYARVIT